MSHGPVTIGPEHSDVAYSLNYLAMLYNSQGRCAEAEPLVERAILIDEKAFGPDHPLYALRLTNLALLYHNQGRYAEAEPLYKRALSILDEAIYTPDLARSNLAIDIIFAVSDAAERNSTKLEHARQPD